MTTQPFDFESLTLDEVETIELITGSSIDTLMNQDKPKGKALKALIYIGKKRKDPNFTLEDAGKVSLKDAQSIFLDESDPKD